MPELIFIQGIMHRSGTNLLHDLVALHPDVEKVQRPVWESFFLSKIHWLDAFGRAVSREWDPDWNVDDEELRTQFGSAITGFLADGRDSRFVVTKTPSVHNLHRFFDFFPGSYLLVLVRDGRAVVESGVRSFGWDRDMATRSWAHYARVVETATEGFAECEERFQVVRYEDLMRDRLATMESVWAMLGLDAREVDIESAANVPVRGSSDLAVEEGGVHWRPVDPKPSFDPLRRFADWSPARHRRFNHLAGAELRLFGYEPRYETTSFAGRVGQRIRDLVDVRWRLRLAYRAWLRFAQCRREMRAARRY